MGNAGTELGWGRYIAKAFTVRWNMLIFGAAVVAGVISGVPDIAIPLVLAGEMTYLAALSANTKFRKAIDAQHHKALNTASATARAKTRVEDVLGTLSTRRRERFTSLRNRCLEMSRLAAGVRGDAHPSSTLHTESLERMLWVFLRLLASEKALERFLETTDAVSMRKRVAELEKRTAKAKKEGNEKILRALIDSMATAQLRVDNLQKAEDNAEFVEIELDRIEDQIQALVEMGVGHEDPDFLSGQVDSVTASISHTEEAMRDLSFLPGVDELEESTPSILSVPA